MKRLPITGSSLATPWLGEEELTHVLAELGAAAIYDDAAVHDLYMKLAEIYGAWLAEQEAKQVGPAAQALRKAGTNLREVATLLSGHQTGLTSTVAIHTASQVAELLARDPTVGSIDAARELLRTLTGLADKVSRACLVAYAGMTDKATGGRDRLDWYDEFTRLLLNIADHVGINPNLNKDRMTGQRGGWLFRAAQALEPFLDPYMRSPSPEACGTRLERSRKRLLNLHRQNAKSK
jgi:hypothetical protein